MRLGCMRRSRKRASLVDKETETLSAKIEVSNGQGTVEIELDQNAIDRLIQDLKSLKSPSEHVHYFSEDWGGYHLTLPSDNNAGTPVHHIKITKV